MSRMCMSCGNYLTEGADCPDCAMSDALVKAAESDQLRARIAELEANLEKSYKEGDELQRRWKGAVLVIRQLASCLSGIGDQEREALKP